MKKPNCLLLLIPSLFLLTSCGAVTPPIDGISEEEAQEFIKTHYLISEYDSFKPSSATLTYNIKEDYGEEEEEFAFLAHKTVYSYLYTEGGQVEENKGKNLPVDGDRLDAYVSELEKVASALAENEDAFVGLNFNIYSNLYNTQGCDGYSLKYKRVGSGLRITSVRQSTTSTYTRTHTYDKLGHETKFSLSVNEDEGNLIYTIDINFKY